MAQFDYYLNRQGVRGPQGIQGEQGFSPIITVATNTLSEYVLQIQTQNNTFLTANLREHKDDLGGTYIRYNRETGVMFAGDADVASQSQMGVVRFATATDIERETEDCVVSPANVADMIEASSSGGSIPDLERRVGILEDETESLEGSVSDNSLAISELQSSVSGLLANYVPKTRTINGYALSSNITLTASDVNAYSKSEADTLLANKADVSDLPDMNNYYNTTQIDLMLNEKADISDIPTVGNGVITINQGGVQKGQFSLNQSGNATINLTDGGGGGGGSYTAGNGIDITNDVISALPDGTTIDFNTDGELKVISAPTPNNMVTTDTTQTISGLKEFSGGLTTSDIRVGSNLTIRRSEGQYVNLYTNLDSGNISSYALTSLPIATTSALGGVIPDGTTITVDANGVISSSGGSTPSNMVTTDTAQTISGAKTISGSLSISNGETSMTASAGNTLKVGNAVSTGQSTVTNSITTPMQYYNSSQSATGNLISCRTRYVSALSSRGSAVTVGDANNAELILQSASNAILTTRNGSAYTNIDTGNIGNYIPTASTSTLGGVKVDGTTITINNNGVISSSGGGGSSYTAGTGIDITNDVISIDDTVVATQTDLDEKQDVFSSVAPLVLDNASIGNAYSKVSGSSSYVLKTNDAIADLESVRLCTSEDTPTNFPWDGTGSLVLDIGFSLKDNIQSSWYGNPFGIIYTLNGNTYSNLIHFDGYAMGLSASGARTVTLQPNVNYQIRMILDMDNLTSSLYYKQASADTYTIIESRALGYYSSTRTYVYINNNLYDGSSGYPFINSGLSKIKLTANNTVIFESTDSQALSLNIGTGLSVVNGALTATATPVTVDQTYNASSTNAQSGTAVAGAIADKVDSSDLVSVHVVTETYVNGASWYRVYSDNWCEQGGNISSTITFLKPFIDTNYTLTTNNTHKDTSGGTATYNDVSYFTNASSNKTTTGVSISGTGMWQACGYIS